MPGPKNGFSKSNTVTATQGKDVLNGTPFDDTFVFKFTNNKNPKDDTLNNQDRIQHYEYGETIKIEGILLDKKDIDYSIDQKNQELTIKIDTDGDGKADVSMVVADITRADVVSRYNEKTKTTEIQIFDDPIELGDGEQIMLIENQHVDEFSFAKEAEGSMTFEHNFATDFSVSDYDMF